MFKKAVFCVVAAMSCACLGGCMTIGPDIQAEQIQAIQVGVTSREDLTKEFGPPDSKQETSRSSEKSRFLFDRKDHFDREADALWMHAHVQLIGPAVRMKSLEVWLDPQDKVQDYLVTSMDASVVSGPEIDMKKVENIKAGITSKSDLEKIFGSPDIDIHGSRRTFYHAWIYYTAGFLGFGEKTSLLQVVYGADGKVDKFEVQHDLDGTPLGTASD